MAEMRVLKQFMVEVNLPSIIDETFVNLIPGHRKMINDYMGEGLVLSYTLSANRDKLWMVVLGENTEKVNLLLETLPLHSYMNYSIYELAFHNYLTHRLPELSLN